MGVVGIVKLKILKVSKSKDETLVNGDTDGGKKCIDGGGEW